MIAAFRSRSRARRALVALVCGIAFVNVQWSAAWRGGGWVAAVQAQGGAVHSTLAVLVVPVQRKNADEAEALERVLSEATGRLDAVRYFDLSPTPAPEATVQAADLVEEGLRALLLRTPKRAQERLEAAVKLLAENPMAGDERLFARLYKGQGLVWLANNEIMRARDAVMKSLLLFPTQGEEEYAAYGTTARELFDSVKQGIASAPTGDLKVVVKGGKADIWVDGVHRGNGLISVTDLPAGAHLVAVRSSGMLAERRFVEVPANGKAVVAEFDMKSAPFGTDLDQGRNVLIANFNQPSVVEDRIRELRNQLGADQMLVVRPKLGKKATELSGYFLGADGTFRKIDVAVDKDETYLNRLGEFVATTVGSKLLPDPSTLPLDMRQSVVTSGTTGVATTGVTAYIDPNAKLFEDDDVKARPITSEWWFWAGVAGGATLVGGALYWLTAGAGEEAKPPSGTLSITLHKTSGNN